jgi:hypothetical protein
MNILALRFPFRIGSIESGSRRGFRKTFTRFHSVSVRLNHALKAIVIWTIMFPFRIGSIESEEEDAQ